MAWLFITGKMYLVDFVHQCTILVIPRPWTTVGFGVEILCVMVIIGIAVEHQLLNTFDFILTLSLNKYEEFEVALRFFVLNDRETFGGLMSHNN